MKKENNLTIIYIIAMVIIVAAVIGSWFMKIIDIMTTGIILVAVGVIFYFIFVGINYKHSSLTLLCFSNNRNSISKNERF